MYHEGSWGNEIWHESIVGSRDEQHVSQGYDMGQYLPQIASMQVVQFYAVHVVQNFLAREIYPSAKRSDHVSPWLHKLDWLPVSSRIGLNLKLSHLLPRS